MWIHCPGVPSASAPASADSNVDSDSLSETLSRHASWKGKLLPAKSWRRVLRTASSTTRLCGLTCEPSTVARGVEEWIASLPPSPVKGTPSPAVAISSKTLATCGRIRGESFARWDASGSLWRTLQASLFPSENGDCPPASQGSSESWPKTGLMRNGSCWVRGTVQAVIRGNASGYSRGDAATWPTCRMGGANRNSRGAITNRNGHPKGRSDLGLEQAADVMNGTLPEELRSADELPPQWRDLWATATAHDRTHTARPVHHGVQLANQAEAFHPSQSESPWATPTARDGKDGACQDADVPTNGLLGRQAVRESTWQTATVTDACGRDYVYPSGDHSKPFLTLVGQAQDEAWMTPTARANHDCPSERASSSPALESQTLTMPAASAWPTPRASENENRTTQNAPTHGVTHGKTLAGEACDLWQTPQTPLGGGKVRGGGRGDEKLLPGQAESLLATDCPSPRPDHETPTPGEESSPNAPTSPPPSKRRLNPQFVEWLMRWPQGWTSRTPIDRRVYACLEMESTRLLRRLLS